MIYHPEDVTVFKDQDGNVVGYQVPCPPPPSEQYVDLVPDPTKPPIMVDGKPVA